MNSAIRASSIGSLLLAAFLAFGGGCAAPSPYYRGFHFSPEPALVDIYQRGGEGQKPPVSVMASIIGIRRGGSAEGSPPAIEVRMRVENSGVQPVTLDPASLELQNGSLQTFERPEVHGKPPLTTAPGQTREISIFFPFPPGFTPANTNLESLRLRWAMQLNGQTVPQTAYFERSAMAYHEGE